MKITFLGTGTSQGIPVIACDCPVCTSTDPKDKRLRTSVHIEVNGLSINIDTGPDFRQQILSNHIRKLDAVLFTHEHRDHVAGLDDVRSFNFKQKKAMPVYGSPNVLKHIKSEFHYAFAEKKYPGVPQIELHEIHEDPFEVSGIKVTPIKVMHYKLPVLGFRINDFTYVTDANYISEEEKKKLLHSKVLVLNALQKEPHLSHFTMDQALELIDEVKPEQAYLTHMSHNLGRHEEVSKELPDHVHLAYDGLTLNI